MLKEQEPDYMADEPMNRAFRFKGTDSIIAYQFQAVGRGRAGREVGPIPGFLDSGSGQRNAPLLRIWILPVEESGVADRADQHAPAFIGNLFAEFLPLVAIRAEEAQLDQLLAAEKSLQFVEEGRRQPAAPNLQHRLERLALAAQKRTLGAGKWKFVHGSRMPAFASDGKKQNGGRTMDCGRWAADDGLHHPDDKIYHSEFGTRHSHPEGIQRQFPPLAGRHLGEIEVAEARAVQRQHRGADRGEHSPDLVIPALGEG